MAYLARLNGVRLSDPDGQSLVLDVSILDDTQTDPKSGGPLIVSSKSLPFPPFDPSSGPQKNEVKNQVLAYGAGVRAAVLARDAFLAQFPPGTTITVP